MRWLYLRFSLSFRDIEDVLAERGLDISYETVRRWVNKFGPMFARKLRQRRPRASSQWHLDEMAALIRGQQFWLWRAVDSEGEVLDVLIQRRRNTAAALKLMRKRLKKHGYGPNPIVTDKLQSYGAAFKQIGITARHDEGLRKNSRAENLHQPSRRREHKMQCFKTIGSAQRFLSAHAATYLQRSASLGFPSDPSHIPSLCNGGLAGRNRSLTRANPAPFCGARHVIPVTVPTQTHSRRHWRDRCAGSSRHCRRTGSSNLRER